MRGIILDEVRRVELVTVTHPRVQSFLHWRDQQVQSTLEAKFHERAQEREHLQTLLGAPITALLTEQGLLDHYRRHVYTHRPLPVSPPPTCRDCRHGRDDRYTPGAMVCWYGWTSGRPKPLTTLTPCAAFVDQRQAAPAASWYGLRHELHEYLAAHGIRYSAGRWKAHQHDLERAAGTWGFSVGRQWERDVRAWLTACYGPRFFVPQRWLLVTDWAGSTHYREVDGIERVDATHAFVYEIKHHTPGYVQLAQEYVPLLQRAYPERTFTPIEVNVGDPYCGYTPPEAPPMTRLRSLEDRVMNGQYQLLVLAEIPSYAHAEGRTSLTSSLTEERS